MVSGIKGLKGPESGITGPGSGITTGEIKISSVLQGIRDQTNNKNGFRDQNYLGFWDKELTFWVNYGISYEKKIPRQDPEISSVELFVDFKKTM